MKKSTSYYSKGFKRKMLAQAFHKGIIATGGQRTMIIDLLGMVDIPISIKFSKEYKALKYLDSSHKYSLNFEKEIAVSEKGGTINPLTPAVYALHVYNNGDLELFNKQISYLNTKIKVEDDYCYWNYEVGVERFGINAPWVSGISQGVIASAFLRKYKESGEEEYLHIAKGAIGYCLDKKHGLFTETEAGYWVDEYPSGSGKGVLNGFIFFLIALGELASFGFFKEEFQQGVISLIKELPEFHKGNYILYGKNISDLGNELYDKIHFHQLDALYSLTSITGFYSLKEYWRKTSVSLL